MMLPSECDIAIIGAGPVGLFMANLMGLSGHRVVLLERNEGLCALPRAIAFDDETLRTAWRRSAFWRPSRPASCSAPKSSFATRVAGC